MYLQSESLSYIFNHRKFLFKKRCRSVQNLLQQAEQAHARADKPPKGYAKKRHEPCSVEAKFLHGIVEAVLESAKRARPQGAWAGVAVQAWNVGVCGKRERGLEQVSLGFSFGSYFHRPIPMHSRHICEAFLQVSSMSPEIAP
jgi:hypothetical protein